ncbi:hypothetical protein WT97_26510 [Burkholderia sp. MSMB1459WGS]|nr:hypothetical protein WS61_26645 [Burkholderia sp. ABCPW 11]KVT11703.1 hypothetical protein WT24_12755 [Burkholderia sp. MSMB1078WGS]KWO37593.1 hypothetical protein WT97_26510 [Burkholderia sp. MSMB1459WGS]
MRTHRSRPGTGRAGLAPGCVKLPRDNVTHGRFCNDDLPHAPVFHRTRATYDSANFVNRMRIGHTQTDSMTLGRCDEKKRFKGLDGADVKRRGVEPVRL